MADRPYEFGMALAPRMQQLVNNEFLSDVSFKVGKAGKVIVGHKSVLTMASEMFFAQFSGNFADSKKDQPIELPDIEPPVFLEILRFMYSDSVNVTEDNVVDIYYGAQKYLLTGLVKICEEYLNGSIDEKNVLKIFDDNRQHEFPKINELCLAIILDDPLVFFEQKAFLNLQDRSVELIIKSPALNCTEEQLRKAIQEWIDANDESDKVKLPPQQLARVMQCRRLPFYGNFSYTKDMKSEAKFTFAKNVSLYGVGIFIGAEKWTGQPDTVTVMVDVETDLVARRAAETLPVKRDLRVCELVFGKVKIPMNKQCTLTVTMKSQALNMFYLDSMLPADCMKELTFKMLGYSINGAASNYRYSHVAYFLYNIHD